MDNFKRKAKQVLIAAVGINVLNGITYTWSAFSLYMINNWGWTSKEASLPYTLHTVFSVATMAILGGIVDKKGPKLIATLGSISLGMGLILSGFTQDFRLFIIFISIMVGCGIGMHTVTTTPAALKWFPPEKKGLISGLVSGGVALSSIIYAFLGNFLINKYELNKSFLYMGILILVLTLTLARMLDIPYDNIEEKERSSDEGRHGRFSILKDKTFYKIWFMKGFADSAGLMIFSHISIIASIQANWDKGFILIVLVSAFNGLGRVLGGFLSDKIGRSKLLKYIFIIQGVNLLLFSTYNTIFSMVLGVSIAGFCYGSGFGIFPAYISDLYGERNFAQNYGFLLTAWAVGGTIGPMSAAAIFDAVGNYKMAYGLEFVLLLLALAISFTIGKEENLSSN